MCFEGYQFMGANKEENIRFIPLAAESLGVRSMCTYAETSDIKVLIDPGVSLGQRFGLLPHPKEYKAMIACRESINIFASKAEIVTISHYHFDHATPTYTDYVWNFSDFNIAKHIYNNKIVLAKDIRASINPSQRRRGWMLKKTIKSFVKDFKVADNQTFIFGKTKLKFSEPVYHGEENTPLGWVIMLTIEYEDKKIMHASDIQGPIFDKTLSIIFAENPQVVYIGGPPLYLIDYRVKRNILKEGIDNLTKLVEVVPTVILDHHLLRAEDWNNFLKPTFEVARKFKHKLVTAAEFLGKQNNFLEFKRAELYENEKPSEIFMKWAHLPPSKQMKMIPPI